MYFWQKKKCAVAQNPGRGGGAWAPWDIMLVRWTMISCVTYIITCAAALLRGLQNKTRLHQHRRMGHEKKTINYNLQLTAGGNSDANR